MLESFPRFHKSFQKVHEVIAFISDKNYMTTSKKLWFGCFMLGIVGCATMSAADRKNITFRYLNSNGIQMHVAEQGEGPLIILCHGFPETWYSWRHQIPALAEAGFHVVAPDQRGYGKTDKPHEIEAYNIFKLTGDIIGLVNALDKKEAIIIGHDWGAPVAYYSSLLRPDIFKALVLLSVPYSPRPRGEGAVPPIQAAKTAGEANGTEFYQVTFQDPSRTEEIFDQDPRSFLTSALIGASGDAPPDSQWNPWSSPGQRQARTQSPVPSKLPDWLTEADLDFYTLQFEASGFRGGLNWYRNIDFNWLHTGFLMDAKISQPTLFIAGELDGVLKFRGDAYERLEENVPRLSKKVIIPGEGHWIQQENPQEVNRLILEFLKELK